MSSSISPLIEELYGLEARLPVRVGFHLAHATLFLTRKLSQRLKASSLDCGNPADASEVLTNARQLRERLALDSMEASRRLSEAILQATLCAEKVENANRQVALADLCVGRIRSRMRANGIPIRLPPTPLDTVTAPDINGSVTQGSPSFCDTSLRSHEVLDGLAEAV